MFDPTDMSIPADLGNERLHTAEVQPPLDMSNKAEAKGQTRPSSGAENGNGGPKIHYVTILLLGATNVGKSNIALRFVKGDFWEYSEATIGVSLLKKTINVSNQTINFNIYDTAGMERYHDVIRFYYRGAQAAVVVYDVTNSESFSRAIEFIKELRQQANSNIILVFVGNKADVAAKKRAVSRDEAQAFAEQNDIVFTEASAKTGMCVGNVFMDIAQTIARQGVGSVSAQTIDRQGVGSVSAQTIDRQGVGSAAGGPEGRDGGMKIDKNDEKKKGGCCVIQ